MTSQISSGQSPLARLALFAVAVIVAPLLAYNKTPSATQLNELLCVFGWG